MIQGAEGGKSRPTPQGLPIHLPSRQVVRVGVLAEAVRSGRQGQKVAGQGGPQRCPN